MTAFGDGFVGHQVTDIVQKLGIPGSTQCSGTGEACSRDTIEEACSTYAIGAIGQAERWNF
jgi:hypothetical protein